MKFKSNIPKRYAEGYYPHNHDLEEYCANCGYPNGEHYTQTGKGTLCPDGDQLLTISDDAPRKFFVSKKLSEKELMIRKFRKFLYDNDVLEKWYKYNKTKGLGHSLHNLFNKQVPSKWFTYAFRWSDTPEEHDYWCMLAVKWDNECARESN